MDPAPAPYLIRISGHLGATVLSAFPALAARHHGSHTVLTGLLDRSALYGVLGEIEALGLDLLEIRKLTGDLRPVARPPGKGGGHGTRDVPSLKIWAWSVPESHSRGTSQAGIAGAARP